MIDGLKIRLLNFLDAYCLLLIGVDAEETSWKKYGVLTDLGENWLLVGLGGCFGFDVANFGFGLRPNHRPKSGCHSEGSQVSKGLEKTTTMKVHNETRFH